MKSSSTPHGAWVALALLAGINFMNYYDRLLVVVVSQPEPEDKLSFKLQFVLNVRISIYWRKHHFGTLTS